MDLRGSLQVMGTSIFRVICYGVFLRDGQAAAFQKLSAQIDMNTTKVFQIFDCDWPHRVNMIERELAIEGDLPSVVLMSTRQMINVDGCKVAICMFDGAFGQFSDLLSPDNASQTYSFCFPGSDPVVCLDTSVIASGGWRSIVADARDRLVAEIHVRN